MRRFENTLREIAFHRFWQIQALFLLAVLVTPILSGQLTKAQAEGPTSDSAPESKASSPQVFSGTARDEEKINPSVKLFLAPPSQHRDKDTAAEIKPESKINQYSGTQQYKPGTPAPPIPHHLHTGVSKQTEPLSGTLTKAVRWNYTLTPHNGIMTWANGYAVKEAHQKPILSKQSDFTFAFPNKPAATKTPLQAMQYFLPPPEGPPPLKAVQLALPAERAKTEHVKPALTWNEWYQRTAQVLYDKWKDSSVSPGKATLLITVWNSHNVDCRITEFVPAVGATRNSRREAEFKKAALATVASLDGELLWEFPVAAVHPRSIEFVMDFSQAVGEGAGCAVVHMDDGTNVTR